MSLSLGLDTGGTYTDAVVIDDETGALVAKAKALTTRHDLSIGLTKAAAKVLDLAACPASHVGLVCLSTTLATNALVEGQGGRVGLIMIGFASADLDRAGLRSALGDDPLVMVPGGHNVHGRANSLDMDALEQQLADLATQVTAFAVAGYFAVRNPEHEIAVRDLITARTGKPVTCSHELSARLDGPRRALTTLLNARLIGMIDRLIEATRRFLGDHVIEAPLMVVRGDGSLVSAEFARLRPIETILSGPAASLVGARHLTGREDAFVSDIGGTTTDIALLDEGQPRIDPDGAQVGGHRTMVEAVAVRTFGLGGDSEVTIDDGALRPELNLGPRRLIPLSLLDHLYEGQIIPVLERQLAAAFPGRLDGRFAMRTDLTDDNVAGLSRAQTDLLSRLGNDVIPLETLMRSTADLATLDRLVFRGVAQIAGFTPSDAQHVLGHFSHWNGEAARLGAALFARRKDGYGKPIAGSAQALAHRVVARLERLSAERVLGTAFSEDGLNEPALTISPLARRALDRDGRLVRIALLLDRPVIGLGAGAGAYYPGVADLLGTEAIVPDHADVANAIGAVVGQVRVQVHCELTLDEEGHFVVSGADLPATRQAYPYEDEALHVAMDMCRQAAVDRAIAAGAPHAEVTVVHDIKAVVAEGERQFVSATITATAIGRPARH